MPYDLDELQAVNDRLARILESGARERLMALPDVVHVAVGLREARGRAVLDDFVFKVYVREKVPAAELPPGRLLPETVDGVPIDVCEVLRGVPLIGVAAADEPPATPARPLLGGVKISNGILGLSQGQTGLAPGTLGVVAVRRSDRKPVMLTNWHVLAAFGGRKGDLVYQPGPGSPTYPPGTTYPKRPLSASNEVGTFVDWRIDSLVDAAIAQVYPGGSCCGSKVTYSFLIRGLNQNGSTAGIAGSKEPLTGMQVVKVGMMSNRVEGTILTTEAMTEVTYDDGTRTFTGQLLIQGHEDIRQPGDPVVQKRFSEEGDSGSVVVEQSTRKVVGLLYGGERPPAGQPPASTLKSFANKITDVITELGIYFPASDDTTATGGGFSDGSVGVPLDAAALFPELGQRLGAGTAARVLLEPLLRHGPDIVRLVNQDRRTTVAWHRAQGPSWLAAFARGARVADYRLPDRIEGVTREEAVTALRTVLAERGGDALRADLSGTAPAVFAALATCPTVDDLLSTLDQLPTTPTAAERRG
ncbi:hypothetical protein ACFWXK_02575 [Streptomyces sp. NPDC059070]|uniref:hypothetical protein n=1 Tax=unclassified Streptomyces TaxID=2593676 RepID=UPI0034E20966